MPAFPFVTIAVPCRDEEAFIEACVRAAQSQDWPADRLEILVADGMSMDATREILARLAAEDSRIGLLDNPDRAQAAGLNECIRRARGDVIVRMDTRADYARDFVRKCVEVLERTGADNVGGSARPRSRTFFQRCVAAAVASPLGVGGTRYGRAEEGFVESVWPGAFRRDVFERVGMFDPKATASEDAELDQRITHAGGRVYRSRDIVVYYYPRDSIRSLAKQYFKVGQGSSRTLLKHGLIGSRPWPQAPPFAALAAGALLLLKKSSGWPLKRWSLSSYAFSTGAEAVRLGRHEGLAALPVVCAIFPVLHASYGAGLASGLVRYALHPDWKPTERLRPRGRSHAAADNV